MSERYCKHAATSQTIITPSNNNYGRLDWLPCGQNMARVSAIRRKVAVAGLTL